MRMVPRISMAIVFIYVENSKIVDIVVAKETVLGFWPEIGSRQVDTRPAKQPPYSGGWLFLAAQSRVEGGVVGCWREGAARGGVILEAR